MAHVSPQLYRQQWNQSPANRTPSQPPPPPLPSQPRVMCRMPIKTGCRTAKHAMPRNRSQAMPSWRSSGLESTRKDGGDELFEAAIIAIFLLLYIDLPKCLSFFVWITQGYWLSTSSHRKRKVGSWVFLVRVWQATPNLKRSKLIPIHFWESHFYVGAYTMDKWGWGFKGHSELCSTCKKI